MLFTLEQIIKFGTVPETGICYYSNLVTFDNGKQAFLQRLAYTVGICFDLHADDGTAKHRWCYSTYIEAQFALNNWDGEGSPQGAIKQKY